MESQDRQLPENIRNTLSQLHGQLQSLYGQRLSKVILFGSQARGDAKAESDVDVLVVLEGPAAVWEEINRTSWIASDLSLRHNLVISCVFMDRADFETGSEPLCVAVHREGIEV